MTEQNPLISVIVPVYKVEKYLHRCVDSILAQTYTNLEIILIDDGSPDRCGAICDEYAAQDPRVRVIHQENKGLSAARNAGLDICSGEYITFVDADDYIEPDMITQLRETIGEADICGCGTIRQDQEGNILSITMPDHPIAIPGQTVLSQHYSGENGNLQIVPVHVWGQLCRSALFRQLRFREGIFCEDMHLMPYILMQCSSVKYLPYAGYHYLTNPGSITNQDNPKHLKKCYEDCFSIWEDHEAFYRSLGMEKLADEVNCTRMDKIIAHMLAGNVPQGCEDISRTLLYKTALRLLLKPIGVKRKLRYAAFCLLGRRGYRLLRKA